jgi:ankyrin repeat protein
LSKSRHKRTAIIAGLIALLLFACLGWVAYSGVHQDRLDRALFVALEQGNPAEVTSLLKQGANPNARDRRKEPAVTLLSVFREMFKPRRKIQHGEPALIFVSTNGNDTDLVKSSRECIQFLVIGGVDVNVQDADGWTAMMHRIQIDDINTVIYLLNHGAKPDIANSDGNTALQLAARYSGSDDLQLLNALLAHGAIVNNQDKGGETALDCAALYRHIKWVKGLLAHGANPMLRDRDGNIALDYANLAPVMFHGFSNKAQEKEIARNIKEKHEIIHVLKLAVAKQNMKSH